MRPAYDGNGVDSEVAPSQSKRPSRSLRTVAELDPVRLEHKRTIDRNAQRSFRERTKAQIRRLEYQVVELSSSQPEAMVRITKERDDLESANERLRGRIRDIENALKAIIQPGAKDVYHASESVPLAVAGGETDTAVVIPASSSPENPPNCTSVELHVCTTQSRNWRPEDLFTSSSMNMMDVSSLISSPKQPLPSENGDATLQVVRRHGSDTHQTNNNEQDLLNMDSWLHSMEVFGDIQLHPPIPWEPPSLHPYQILPLNTAPTCSLDVTWLDFIASCTSFSLSEGNRETQLNDSNYPTINNLLNSSDGNVVHPLGDLLANILRTFCHQSALPEQVAVLYKMYLILKWQVAPTRENYELLPHWLRPTTAQILTPHPAWMDQCAWPKVRDHLIHAQHIYTFQRYSNAHMGALSVNWLHNPADVLIRQENHGGTYQVIINPVFEEHVRDLSNWTLEEKIVDIFPDIYPCCKP